MAAKANKQDFRSRDFQRQRLYDFENENIERMFPLPVRQVKLKSEELRIVPDAHIQKMLGMGWKQEGSGDGLTSFTRKWRPEVVRLTLPQCAMIVQDAVEHMRVRMPMVKDGRRCSRALGGADRVIFPLWSRQTWVVLHETAHTICEQRHLWLGNDYSWHGPHFCRVYFHLIARTGVIGESELVNLAKEEGLKVAPESLIPRLRKLTDLGKVGLRR